MYSEVGYSMIEYDLEIKVGIYFQLYGTINLLLLLIYYQSTVDPL